MLKQVSAEKTKLKQHELQPKNKETLFTSVAKQNSGHLLSPHLPLQGK